MNKEACIGSLAEAIGAYDKGADRLEVCSHLDLDGLTPSGEMVMEILEKVPLPIRVMIRPKGGDFVYSEKELRQMEKEILYFKKLAEKNHLGKLEGVVLGILDKKNLVDVEKTHHLASLASPLKVVFHKAIDSTPDIYMAFEKLSNIPQVTDILTSGGEPKAAEGAGVLKNLVERFEHRFSIISAGSIRPRNINELHEKIGGEWYHGRRIV